MQCGNELVVRIRQNGDIIVEDVENGVIGHKKISPTVFMDCIRQTKCESMTFASGLLPKGCISYNKGEKTNRICIDFGVQKCDISYYETKYPDFQLPRLLFGFTIEEERIVGVDIGVVGMERLTPKSKMYVYPFSNVSEFRLCLGANAMPKIKSLHQLESLMYHILSMPNNNDHYRPERTCLEMEYRELLETVKDKPPEFYYTDVLKEMGKTLADFVKG